MRMRNADAREQVVDLADAVHLDAGVGQLLQVRAPGRRQREVAPAPVRSNAPGAPPNGRAITRPTACSPLIAARAASHARYSSCGETRSTCAASCSTESCDVYTISAPLRSASAPKSSIAAIPLYGRLQISWRPVAAADARARPAGSPPGTSAALARAPLPSAPSVPSPSPCPVRAGAGGRGSPGRAQARRRAAARSSRGRAAPAPAGAGRRRPPRHAPSVFVPSSP